MCRMFALKHQCALVVNLWYDLVLSALGPTALVPTALDHTRVSPLGHSDVSTQTSSTQVMFSSDDDDDNTLFG